MKQKIKIQTKPIEIANMKIKIKGSTPLISCRFTEEKQNQILDKQTRKNPRERQIRNIEKEAESFLYKIGNKVAFPTDAFKRAMVESAPYLQGADKKLVKGSLFIVGESGTNLIPLKYSKIETRKDRVRLADGTTSIAVRPQINNWSCQLNINFNRQQITENQIVELLKLAGFHIGVGAWRPSCNGSFGMFVLC